jgi:enoyl-CoA hydratase/carnithine racemase
MTNPLVTTTTQDHVTTLHLGAAPAHPLSAPMIHAISKALDQAAADPDTNVVVLYGQGKIFCAGHDLKEIARNRSNPDHGEQFLTDLFNACADMMQKLASFPKPTIAMVDGIATAAGLQMMASCDLAFASENAGFCLPGVNNGGFCTTPAVGVSRTIVRKHLMELLLSGETKTADWALATGLISRIIPAKTLEQETQNFAKMLASRNAAPISAGKTAVLEQLDMALDAAYAHATPVMVSHFMDAGRLAAEKESKFKG